MLRRCGTGALACATILLAAVSCRERVPVAPPRTAERRNISPPAPAPPPPPPPQSPQSFWYPIYRIPPRLRPDEPVRNPDVRPEVIKRVEPEYTEAARKARIAGIVVLELLVETNGRVSAGRVLKGLPFGLTQKAIDAVREWRFSPAKYRGRAVRAYRIVTINFRPPD